MFHALRMEGFTLHPNEFRIAPEDEADLSLDRVATRLAESCVVGAFQGDVLVGIGGLTRETGNRLRHKALLWGMYVRSSVRGTGVADGIIEQLLDHARAASTHVGDFASTAPSRALSAPTAAIATRS